MPEQSEQQVSKERFELIKGSAELNHYLNGFQADDLIAFAVQQEQAREAAEAAHELMSEQFRIMQAEKEHGWRESEKQEDRAEKAEAERDAALAELAAIAKSLGCEPTVKSVEARVGDLQAGEAEMISAAQRQRAEKAEAVVTQVREYVEGTFELDDVKADALLSILDAAAPEGEK